MRSTKGIKPMESVKEQIVDKIMTQDYSVLEAFELATNCIDETKQSLKQPVTWYIGATYRVYPFTFYNKCFFCY